MNVIKQYNIPYKGLSKGTHLFEFDVNDALFKAFEGSEIKGGTAKVNIELERAASMLVLDVAIKGKVVVECDRCLDDMEIPVDYHATLDVKFSEETDEYDGDVMWINPADDFVELGQYIYESIFLSLPYTRAHGESDKGGASLCNPDMLFRYKTLSPEEFDRMAGDSETHLAANPELEKLKEALENQR